MIFLSGKKPLARVAFNMRPRRGSYGGGNQWLTQTAAYLKSYGYAVQYDLTPDVDLVLGTHAGLNGELSFSYDDVLAAKRRNSRLRCIQRVNDCDIRKKSAEMDGILEKANAAADHTVFISEWLRDYFVERWFDPSKPHSVIYNGADPLIYHPIGSPGLPAAGEPFRIVTHHWSDNPMKGFDVYEQLDGLIADGALRGFELVVIGRWPARIKWRSAKTLPPMNGEKLATELRKCHLYLTASLWEPCGMHHVEGAQCGLPLLYHADGGGINEAGRRYGLEFRDDLIERLQEMKDRFPEFRQKVLSVPPSGDLMSLEFRRLVQSQLCQ